VMSVLRIKVDARSGGGQVSYAGVGNVDFCSQTANGFRPLNAYGIIGSRFPKVRQFEGVYAPGDLFVLSTDGITRQFNLDKIQPTPGQSPQALAQTIADKFSRLEDDVTVLVVV
jgi:hypothetical protein